jgi:hypothetical protein
VRAGSYLLSLRGQQPTRDASVHAELLHRPRQGGERLLAQADGVAGQGVSGGLSGDMDLTLTSDAIASTCGDKLVLKLAFVAGASHYQELFVNLMIP